MSISVFDTVNKWVGEQLATSTGPGAYALLFIGGLLASLLPCVYPLYPITVSILRVRKSRLGTFAHPLAYYAGLSTVYLVFGIAAAMTGGAFNEVLRIPAVNLGIGVMLFLLALSTAQLLVFPAVHSASEDREGLLGTCAMGAGAGLLSSACVGPVVVSILVAIATHTASISATIALGAALKMFTFGLGVGFPILLIGIVGLTLPRGGRWMVGVQWGFAVLVAYFAWGYILKSFAGLGFKDDLAHAVVGGAALLLFAVFFLQDQSLAPQVRMKKSLLVVAGVTGALVMARNLQSAPPAASSANVTVAGAEIEMNAGLTWYLDKDAAYRAAANAGKPVFLDFHGDWCSNCKAFQERVANDPDLNAALKRAVLLKVHDGSALFRSYTADPRFPELKVGLPFFIVTDPGGNVIYKTSDFTRTDEIIIVLSG